MTNNIFAESAVLKKSLRLPTLQGLFYPADAVELSALLATCFNATVTSAGMPKGIVVPHAGYVYSGHVAAVSYARINPAFHKTFIIIGTNHSGYETACADFVWDTPLGTVSSDTTFINVLKEYLPLHNEVLRRKENSIEVQLPFIRYRFPAAKIVPIVIGDQSIDGSARVAAAVVNTADALGQTAGKDFVVVASGDGSHYVPKEQAEHDDLHVLDAAKRLDIQKFYEALEAYQPSMCGYGCIAAACGIGNYFGAEELRLLQYSTSGDVTGDYTEVVGYAALEVV